MNESYLQYRGAHYLFLPEPPPKDARCVVCRGPWAGDAFCERCHAPMDFDCHQNRVITPAERQAFQAMLDELNATLSDGRGRDRVAGGAPLHGQRPPRLVPCR